MTAGSVELKCATQYASALCDGREQMIAMLQRAALLLRGVGGRLPIRVLLLSLAIVVFGIVLLPSIVFPIVGLYIVWRLPLGKKATLYAAYIYLIAAVAALWWLEVAMSDRGIHYYGTGYIGIIPSLVLTVLAVGLLIANFVDAKGQAQFEFRNAKEEKDVQR